MFSRKSETKKIMILEKIGKQFQRVPIYLDASLKNLLMFHNRYLTKKRTKVFILKNTYQD